MQKRQRLAALLMVAVVVGLVAMLLVAPAPVMAAQTVTPQDIGTTSFISMTLTTEDGTGFSFANNGRCLLAIQSAVSTTCSRTHYITVTTDATFHGFAVADLTDTIYSSSPKIIGPFNTSLFNDSSGNVTVDIDPYGWTGDYSVTVLRY